jgi:BlaI family penicillinase repressor
MSGAPQRDLSRRERQIMGIIYRRGQATAAEIREEMPDAPSDSTVRTLLRVLVAKGHVRQRFDGPRYVYSPKVPAERAKRSALRQLLATFFDGSAAGAMATLIDMSSSKLAPEELDRLARLIEDAKKGEKP